MAATSEPLLSLPFNPRQQRIHILACVHKTSIEIDTTKRPEMESARTQSQLYKRVESVGL